MKLGHATFFWQINLPLKRNDGRDYADAIATFEKLMVRKLGGFTRLADAKGAWYSEDSDKVFYDDIAVYQVACTDGQFAELGVDAGKIFPDQECIFAARIGRAAIIAPIDNFAAWDAAVWGHPHSLTYRVPEAF